MLRLLAASWWLIALRGALFILLGILALVNPGMTAATLAIWLGAIVAAEGVLTLIAAAVGRTGDESRWLVALEGALGLVLGVLIFRNPGAVLLGISLLFAGWMIFSGALRVAAAIHLRKEIEGEFWLGLTGVVSILFGIVIAAEPALGIVTLLVIIGVFALLYGGLQIALGLRLRTLTTRVRSAVQGV